MAGRRISVRTSFVWSMTAARSFFWRATRPWSSPDQVPKSPTASILNRAYSSACFAVEMLDARLQVDGYVDPLVEHPLLDVDGHAAQGIDDGGKPCKIGLDCVVDAETRQQVGL